MCVFTVQYPDVLSELYILHPGIGTLSELSHLSGRDRACMVYRYAVAGRAVDVGKDLI